MDLEGGELCRERMLIGALLWSETDRLSQAIEILEPKDFERPDAAAAFRALMTARKPEMPERRMAVLDWLEVHGGEKTRAEWAMWMIELQYLPDATAAWAIGHARAIRDRSILKQAKTKAMAIASDHVSTDPDDVEMMLAESANAFQEMRTKVADRHVEDGSHPADRVLEDALAARTIPRLEFGILDLDMLVGRIEPTDLILVAARPSCGKTAFALQVMLNQAKKRRPSIIFSLEMTKLSLGRRWVTNVSGVPLQRIRSGHLLENDEEALGSAESYLKALPLSVVEKEVFTVEQLQAAAERLVSVKPVSMIVVDYIQLLTTSKKTGSRNEEVSHISRTLKNMAKELEVPVLAISQLSRTATATEEPQLWQLRDSGSLEQDGDVILMLWEHDDLGKVKCGCKKNRNGATGTIELAFYKDTQRIEEPPRVSEALI